jgi:hypothetical protein
MMLNPALPYLRGKHGAEPVPPEAHRLMTDVDAAFEQQVLDLAQRKWVAHIHHHRQANDLGLRVEIAERIFIREGYEPPVSASTLFTLTAPKILLYF